jgi:hypothetical protein
MLRIGLSIAFLFVAVCVPIAAAGTIHYTITFSGGPMLPTAGSFNYDPDSPHFTDFVVQWDNYTFDLTESANAPFTSDYYEADPWFQGTTGAAASFLMLSECSSSPCNGWTVSWSGGRNPNYWGGWFEFKAVGPESQIFQVWYDWNQGVTYGQLDGASGSWSINSQVVPEPSLLILLGIGLAGVIGCSWR